MTNKLSSWIAVIGEPNAGKSTLFNHILGSKISITTPKAQTTRNSIKGILTRDSVQLVFIDTPGFLQPKKKIDKMMQRAIHDSIPDSDHTILIHDSSKKISDNEVKYLTGILPTTTRVTLVLNKIDKIDKQKLLEKTSEFSKIRDFHNVFMISALKHQGVDDLVEFLASQASEPGWHFSEHEITTAPVNYFIKEIMREKILLNTHKEIPYEVLLKTEATEISDKIIKSHIIIYISSNSQKKILIGSEGGLLKKISSQTRKDLESIFGKKFFIRSHIKVKDWDKSISNTDFINY